MLRASGPVSGVGCRRDRSPSAGSNGKKCGLDSRVRIETDRKGWPAEAELICCGKHRLKSGKGREGAERIAGRRGTGFASAAMKQGCASFQRLRLMRKQARIRRGF